MRLIIQVQKESFINYPLLPNTPEDFRKFMDDFLSYFAQVIIDRLKEVVRRQLYTWEPLSENYKAFKKRMGLDPRIWYASGQLLEAVKYWYVPLSDGYYIGVHPRLKHRVYVKGGIDSGRLMPVRLIDIIKWMEFGTTKMPARPLFTTVLDEFRTKGAQQKVYAEFIAKRKGIKL